MQRRAPENPPEHPREIRVAGKSADKRDIADRYLGPAEQVFGVVHLDLDDEIIRCLAGGFFKHLLKIFETEADMLGHVIHRQIDLDVVPDIPNRRLCGGVVVHKQHVVSVGDLVELCRQQEQVRFEHGGGVLGVIRNTVVQVHNDIPDLGALVRRHLGWYRVELVVIAEIWLWLIRFGVGDNIEIDADTLVGKSQHLLIDLAGLTEIDASLLKLNRLAIDDKHTLTFCKKVDLIMLYHPWLHIDNGIFRIAVIVAACIRNKVEIPRVDIFHNHPPQSFLIIFNLSYFLNNFNPF